MTKVVAFPYTDGAVGSRGDVQSWADFTQGFHAKPVTYTRLDFNAPLVILFSSGTTGLPKCITHSVGGLLMKHIQEHVLQCDIQPRDRFFYFTTCGWMMWNWLVSGLATGATLYLFDGSPFFPDGTRLSELARSEGITTTAASNRIAEERIEAVARLRRFHL